MHDTDEIGSAGHVVGASITYGRAKPMDLDELLDRSVPPTAPRTAMLQHELERMVANIEVTVRPRRKAIRFALTSAISAGLLGVGTAGAMAAGIVPSPS